nr:hypothetical protein [Actinomycetota bacterium]
MLRLGGGGATAETVAGITLPEGDPAAVQGAAQSVVKAAGGFERTASVVQRALGQVGSWRGAASLTFRDRCATYEDAGRAAQAACERAAIPLRHYGDALEEGRRRVRQLQCEAEDCLEALRDAERRAAQAGEREADASGRAMVAALS